MSRIGKEPIAIPAGVEVKVDRLNLESYIGLHWKSLFLYEFTHCKDNCSVLKEVDWLILNTYTG